MNGRRPGRAPIGRSGLGLDLALVGLSVATAVSLVRAFRTWDELGRLVAIVVAAHGLSHLGRRLRLGALTSTFALLAAGTVVITLLWYRGLSTFGLPGPAVVDAAVDDLRTAFGPFRTLVAPVDALPGFTLAFAIGLWLMAVFADLAAVRAEAPVQAAAPHVAVFVFSSVLLLGRHATVATVVFTAALIAYRLALRATQLAVDGQRGVRARRATWAMGLPVAAVAVVGAALIADAAPTGTTGIVDLRANGRGPGARTVESPLVSIDALLGGRSDTVLFTVESDLPHYWRLTSLDDFDGRSWSASAKYRDIDDSDTLTSPTGDVAATDERIDVEIEGLESDWLPAVPDTVRVDAPVAVRYDDGSGSIFVADDESTSGVDYSLTAAVPALDAARLGAAPPGVDPTDDELRDDLALPDSYPPAAKILAENLTAGLGPYDAAAALEAFFRSDRFVYDRDVDYRQRADPLLAFLQEGRGFCQQFATAYASMARAAGLPARVAVGFTYGDEEAPDGDSGRRRWTVRGRYAHAWPEVHIAGVGWVAFEPTPGRGNPDATSYSSAPAAQAGPNGESVELGATTTTTTTTVVPTAGGAVPSTSAPDLPRPTAVTSPTTTTGEGGSATGPLLVLAALVALPLLVFGAYRLRVAATRRRRHRDRGPDRTPADRVAASWRQTLADLRRVDVVASASETPTEFARRAARVVEVEELVTLGRRESDRRYRAAPPDEAEAEAAEAASDRVRQVVWSRLERSQRWRADLDL